MDPMNRLVLTGGDYALYHIPFVLFGPFHDYSPRNDILELHTVENYALEVDLVERKL